MSDPVTPTAPDAATQIQEALVPAAALAPPGVAPVAPAPAAPVASPPSPDGDDFGWLNPEASDGKPVAPMAPDAVPVTPAAPAAPPAPPAPPAAATAPPAPAAPAAPAPAVAPASTAWTPEKFISEKIGDPKSFMTDPKKIEQFGGLRDLAGNALKANQALELENAQLKAAGAGKLPEGSVIPESEAITALQGELKEFKADAGLWKEEQARRDLAESPSFRREHDAPRAGILRELNATAGEVEMTKENVQDFLKLGTEFKQAKWIEENVEDETAAGLFKAKGAAFLGLSNQKADALQAVDPIAELQNWQDQEDAFGNQMAVKMNDDISRQFQAAGVRVFAKLTGEDGNIYYKTDAGQAALGEIQQKLADGQGFTPEESITAHAAVGERDAYQALAARFAEQVSTLTAEVNVLKGIDPTANLLGAPGPPVVGGAAPAAGVDPFAGGETAESGTLISNEQLAASLNGR